MDYEDGMLLQNFIFSEKPEEMTNDPCLHSYSDINKWKNLLLSSTGTKIEVLVVFILLYVLNVWYGLFTTYWGLSDRRGNKFKSRRAAEKVYIPSRHFYMQNNWEK